VLCGTVWLQCIGLQL